MIFFFFSQLFLWFPFEITALSTNHWRYREGCFSPFFDISWNQNHVNLNFKWFEFLGRMSTVLIGVRRNPTNRFKLVLLIKVQWFIHVSACVHKGQRGLMDINNLLSDSTIQSWDTYTSTKYLPLMFANVKWQPVYMYNTITSWYTTMYHETSVIFNTREPWAERLSPPNIRTATKVIIVIKNNTKKKKSIFNSSCNHCKCFTRTVSLLTHVWTSLKKKNTVSSPECAADCESKAAVFPPPTTMVATCEALSVITRREQLQLKTHPAPDRPGVEGVLPFHCFGGKRVLSFNKSWPSHSLHTVHSVTNLWQRQLKSNVILQQQIKTPLYTFIYIFIT